jgi:hypothetical protein
MTHEEVMATYYSLLIEAEQTALKVDFFDLRGEDVGSNAEFAALLDGDRLAQLALIGFVLEHADDIKAALA